jgi:hypothetical protein
MTDKEKRELKDGVISIFKSFNILDYTATIGGLRNDILEYINSFQEDPVNENLEKAAVNAFKQIVDSDKNNFLEIFKAGSEWQKQQTISKACKWIDENAAKYLVDRFVGSTRVVGIDTSITDDFRKDMED